MSGEESSGHDAQESLEKVEIALQETSNIDSSVKHLINQERLKPRYQTRRPKSKGAILVLVWNFLVWSAYAYLTHTAVNAFSYAGIIFHILQAVTAGLVMPLTGWLADVRFGRYKVVTWSSWAMWISSLLVTASFVVVQLVESYKATHKILSLALLVPLGIGFCGFQANIIQFGVDQLPDASTDEITSFIVWYAGTFISGRFAQDFTLSCVPKHNIFGPLLLSLHLTVVIATHHLFNHLLIKEPVTQNPFKLVYDVIKYAVNNKHPRQRSAFTFCEDDLPPRIDFGKYKYGGPFTTEQVEDVKTLFRLTLFAFVVSVFYGTSQDEDHFISQLRKVLIYRVTGHASDSLWNCFSNYICFSGFYFITAIVLIPVNEAFVYPIFQRCLPHLKIYSKFILGALLRIGKYITLLTLYYYTRQHHHPETSNATPNNCLFQETPSSLSGNLNKGWFILPQVFHAVSDLLIVISMIEFFCAQVPYSMKGIVAGITYGLIGMFIAFDQIISLPFIMKSLHWGTRIISCGFWYLLMKLLFLILVAILSLFARRCKLRKRQDVLPNEQIFAERYYST